MSTESGSAAQLNARGGAASKPYDPPASSAPLPLFPPQPDLSSSSSLPLPFPFPLFASDASSSSTVDLPTPPPVASTSTAPAPAATDQPFPGFPKVSEFDQQRVGYLDSLDQKKKRAKALVDTDLYNFVRSTLLYPQDTSLRTAQDRFWARATFTLARKGEEPNSASAAAKVLTSLSAAKPPSPPPPTVDAEGETAASAVGDYLVDFSAQPVASTSTAPSPPPPAEPAPSTSTSTSSKPPRTSRRPGRPAVSTPSFLPLLTDSSGAPIPVDESTVVVIHDGLPVAKSEEIFGILVECHRKVEHGGREKTFKEVRTKWAWVPKELVARFIKICPTCIANSTPGIKWRNQTTKQSTSSSGDGAKKTANGKGKKSARGKGKGKGKAKEDEYEDGDEEGGGGEEDADGESDQEEELAVGEEDSYLDPAVHPLPPTEGRIGTRASIAAAGAVPRATSPSGLPAKKKVKVETRSPSKRRAANGTGDTAMPLSPPRAAQQPLPPPPPPSHPSTYYPSPLSNAALPLPLQTSPPSATPTYLPHPYSSSHSTIPSSTPAHPFYTPYQPFATGSLPTSTPSFPLGLQHPAYCAYSSSSLHPQLQPPTNSFPPPPSAYGTTGLATPSYAPFSYTAYPPPQQQQPFLSPPAQHPQRPSANVDDGGASASASASLEDVLRAAEQAQAWAAANPSLLAGAAALRGDGADAATNGTGGGGGRKRARVEAVGESEG